MVHKILIGIRKSLKEKAFSSRTCHWDDTEFLATSVKQASQDTVTKQSMQISSYSVCNRSGVLAGMEHTRNSSTRETEVGGASSRLGWVTQWVPCQPGLHRKVTLPTCLPKSQTQNNPPVGPASHHNEHFGLGLSFCEVLERGVYRPPASTLLPALGTCYCHIEKCRRISSTAASCNLCLISKRRADYTKVSNHSRKVKRNPSKHTASPKNTKADGPAPSHPQPFDLRAILHAPVQSGRTASPRTSSSRLTGTLAGPMLCLHWEELLDTGNRAGGPSSWKGKVRGSKATVRSCGPLWGKPTAMQKFPPELAGDPARPAPTPGQAIATPASGAWRGLAQRSSVPCPPHPTPTLPALYFLHPPLPCSPPALTSYFFTPRPGPSHPLPVWDTLTGSFAGPAHQFTCWSFPRGPWQPSNPEPEAEGGQDPALILRCQAICFNFTDPGWVSTVPGEFTLFSNFCSFSNFLCLRGSCSNQTSFI